MASEVGSAYVSILPSAKGFASNLQREIGTDLARAAKKGGADYGKGFSAAAADQAKRADVTGGIGADAKRAGGKAGDDYGKGFGSAATGQAKRAGSDMSRAAGTDAKSGGVDAGRDFGKAFADEAVNEVDKADIGGSISGKLKAGAAAGAGLLVGGSVVAGFGEALERGALGDKLAAQLGAGSATRKASRVSAELFAGAWGDSVGDVNDAVASVVTNIGGMRHASQRDLKAVTTSVLDIATAFDQDVSAITRAADQLVRTNLAKGPREALDIITKGFQSGANEADDLLDTFSEYGTQFRKMGLDGAEATGLLSQGLQAGARDADIVADSIKEFSLRTVAGLTEVDSKGHAQVTDLGKAFETLGINVLAADGGVTKAASTIQTDLAGGGDKANAALDEMLDRLRAVDDPLQRSQAAVALFGTQAEDMGDALYALDPSKAVDTLGKVGGAATRMGKTLNDNAASQLTSFKRTMQTNFVDFLGNKVIPAAQDLWQDVGPDVQKMGTSFSDMAEAIGPAVKSALPIVADVVGDVASAFGAFGRAFSALPKPLQTAIVTAALAGYGVKKLRGVGLVGGGGGLPLILGGGRAAAATGTVATGEAAVAGGAAAAGAGRMAGIRSLGRTFWPYLLADAGYEALVGDLWGFAPKQGGPRHTGAFGIGAATPGKPLTPHDTQTAAEMSGSRFKALHGLGDMFKIDTTPFFGLGNDFEKLDKYLSHIAQSNPARTFDLLHSAAAKFGVPVRMLTDELPNTAKALTGTGVAARFQARQTRDAHDAGQALWDLFRSDLIPSTQSLADKYDLSRKEARNLRGAISDTTGTAKQHEAQLRQVARQLGLDETQTRQLIKAYRDVPDKVQTDAVFKTNDAARARDNFLTQTKGKFSDLGNQTYAIMVNGQSGHGRVFAEGGWTGPGSKYQPAGVVHAEEFVTRRESRSKMEQRFPGALDYINTHGTLPGYFDGGIVGRVNTKVNMDLSALRSTVSQLVKSLQSAGGSVPATLAWVKRQVGDSYQMGGTGPNAWDCSGFMSGITHHLLGQNPVGSRLFATSTFPTSMFARGPGIFMIGSTRDAGGGIGHMAGTLGGVNVESSGDVGVHIGSSARGAHDPLFGGNVWHLKQGLIKQVIAGGRGDPAGGDMHGRSASAARAYAQSLARSRYGWGRRQFSALNSLWNQESGWRWDAANPSGAYGIPQSLPGSKMAAAGADWFTNPATQIQWGLNYIKGRYHTPMGAMAHEISHGWYDKGGVLKPGFTMAYNGTGRDEYVSKEPPRRHRGPIRIELDIGGRRTLTGVIRDEVNGELDFESTTGRMR